MSERNKAAARVAFEVWSTGELDRLDEYIASDVVHHDPHDPHGAEGRGAWICLACSGKAVQPRTNERRQTTRSSGRLLLHRCGVAPSLWASFIAGEP
jgi:hypothetical protein